MLLYIHSKGTIKVETVKENKAMTVKQEYETMKRDLRDWNNRSSWDETRYAYHIEHHSKKARAAFLKLLNNDFEKMNFDIEHKIITVEQYNKIWKVWNDCSTSIANMNIF